MTIRLILPTSEAVDVDRTLTVGRLPECDVVIADVLVSGNHFEIGPAPGGAQIVDLQSSNGTFVNGERLSAPRVLTGGEEIAVGSQKIMVERVVKVAPVDLRLVVRVGIDTGIAARITDAAPIVIGRGDDADLKLSDPLVSARHCQVVLVHPPAGPCPHCGMLAKPGDAHCVGCGRARIAAEVEDLGSANGVLVDGAPVNPHARADLLEGGELQLGDTIIVFGSESDPVNLGPAPTVIRSIPKNLDAPATPTPPQAAPPAPRRRISPLAWIIGGVAIVAVAIVLVVALSGSDSAPPQTVQQGSVQSVVEGQRDKTVLVLTSYTDGAASGSGVVIDAENGLVLTNAHVIAGGNTFQVRLRDSKQDVAAKLYSSYPCDDLAVLQITNQADRSGLESATFATTDQLEVGEQVVALGFPGSAESASSASAFASDQLSATEGIISKVGAKYIDPLSGVAPLPNTLQHTAAVNHGNSGGPLFDLGGNVVGINTAIFFDTSGQRLEGVNYAVSAQRINELLSGLLSGKAVAEFGMHLAPVWAKGDDETVDPPGALEVTEVATGSPAGTAGIKMGQLVFKVDGVKVTDLIGYCKLVSDGKRHMISTYDRDADTDNSHALSPRVW